MENNALSDIIENKVSGVSQEEKYQNAQKELVAAVKEFKAQNCAGVSAEACSAKISEHRDELLKGAVSFGLDFVPVVGDIKSFAKAQSALDYLVFAVSIIPGAGDATGKAIKAAEAALDPGDAEPYQYREHVCEHRGVAGSACFDTSGKAGQHRNG